MAFYWLESGKLLKRPVPPAPPPLPHQLISLTNFNVLSADEFDALHFEARQRRLEERRRGFLKGNKISPPQPPPHSNLRSAKFQTLVVYAGLGFRRGDGFDNDLPCFEFWARGKRWSPWVFFSSSTLKPPTSLNPRPSDSKAQTKTVCAPSNRNS